MKLINCISIRKQKLYGYESWDENVELEFFLFQDLLNPNYLQLTLRSCRLATDIENKPKYYRFPKYENRLKNLINLTFG